MSLVQFSDWLIGIDRDGQDFPIQTPISKVFVLTQKLRPDADTDTDSWTTTPLWSKVDEVTAGGDVITATAS